MASAIATSRLQKELQKIQRDPPPGIIAEPKESDILVWFYALRGPPETPYEGGVYVGKLKFPSEYPMKPPVISMLTPSGRFEINKPLCLSMSSFHVDTWVPTWSVSSIIQGIQSFMASDELTTGGMQAPESERRKLAVNSMVFNKKTFPDLFLGNIDDAFERADQAREAAEKKALQAAAVAKKASTRQSTVTTKPKPAEAKVHSDKEAVEEREALSSTVELTPEEIEKRRKKNAKKRDKQRAKKSAVNAHESAAAD